MLPVPAAGWVHRQPAPGRRFRHALAGHGGFAAAPGRGGSREWTQPHDPIALAVRGTQHQVARNHEIGAAEVDRELDVASGMAELLLDDRLVEAIAVEVTMITD